MVADMVAFVASQFTTSTWDVGAQELCSVVLIKTQTYSVSDREGEREGPRKDSVGIAKVIAE